MPSMNYSKDCKSYNQGSRIVKSHILNNANDNHSIRAEVANPDHPNCLLDTRASGGRRLADKLKQSP